MRNKLLILFCSLLVTGCWNYNELNELAIINAVGVDYYGSDFLLGIPLLIVYKKEY